MTKLELEIHDDVMSTIDKIRNLDDHGVELIIPKSSILFDNILNLHLLNKEADKMGKKLHFTTNDPQGINLVNMVAAEGGSDEFSAVEVPAEEIEELEVEVPKPRKRVRHMGDKAFISVASNSGRFKKVGVKILIVLLILGGILGVAAWQALWVLPKADVKVVVNSQPLTKSVQTKVVKDAENNAEQKVLKGYAVDTILSNTERIETTGEKTIGEKAEGKIKIYNYTSSEKEFKKGKVVRNEDNDREYELKDSVTIPERTQEADKTITPGEATVDVIATDIGEGYNLDDGKELKIDEEDLDDFVAETDGDIDGGESNTIKVVAQEDLDALKTAIAEKSKEDLEKELASKARGDKIYIQGSIETTVAKEEISHELGEEAEELELTQEISASGMAYSKNDLERVLEKLVQDLIPEGYELSSQDKEINAESLGNSDTTVASTTEADLQVTIKAFVIPIVEQEELRKQLIGISIPEAQRIVGGIKNIQNYELSVSPNIPFLQKMPRNIENINVTIQRK